MTDTQVAMRSARTAFIGAILGALIGGLGSFAGTYATNKNQKDQEVYNRAEAAYVAVLTQAEEYREDLADLADAVSAKDQRTYDSLRARLRKEDAALFAAAVRVDLISDERGKAYPVLEGFYSYYAPSKLDKADENQILEASKKGSNAADEFQTFAISDLKRRRG